MDQEVLELNGTVRHPALNTGPIRQIWLSIEGVPVTMPIPKSRI